MKHYVVARKPGTEVLVGQDGIAIVTPDPDLAVEFADWLQDRGWIVTLSDSTEMVEPRNTPQGNNALSFLVQEFTTDASRLQAWLSKRGPPASGVDGRDRRPSSQP